MKKLKIALAILSLCCLFALVACQETNADNYDGTDLPNVDGSDSPDSGKPTLPDTEMNSSDTTEMDDPTAEPNLQNTDEIAKILAKNGYSIRMRDVSDIADAEERILLKVCRCFCVLNADKGEYVYNTKLNLYIEVYTYSISVFWFESATNAQKVYEYAVNAYAKFNDVPPSEIADYFYINGNMIAFGSTETVAFIKDAVEQAE